MPFIWTARSRSTIATFSRSHDPVTGELLFDVSRRGWQAAGSPLAEVLVMALRTRKGTASRDLSYGLDDSSVENQKDNARALFRLAILDCLSRYVADGRLAGVPTVTYLDEPTTPEALFPLVRFVDASGTIGTITGSPNG